VSGQPLHCSVPAAPEQAAKSYTLAAGRPELLDAEAAKTPLAPAPPEQLRARGVTERASVALPCGARLVVSQGSVLDFGGGTDWPPGAVAAVNAANEGGLSGGGVDGAFVNAGGPLLAQHRRELPELPGARGGVVRIRTGSAVATGPAKYGRLHASTIIHAVGPNYGVALGLGRSLQDCDALLSGAYASSMGIARQWDIQFLGFSLLSAGIFRGPQSLREILLIAINSVSSNSYEGLKEVHLVAFSEEELSQLLECLKTLSQ